ncbi:putative disease resistance RPP13-like protein 3 isoform X2 [Setaria italica]|uniref:putative disease resistance RPP13-like protein 3 isoform X2 n=1 Tax=Setaria italica TaxID=4555 RepID=UPI000BE5E7AF|nr:putative disease resistance RPP13-like protein 3 isoform X2 [Setaria italica]
MESPGEMDERFAPVTAATGALGPVLVKLSALLGDEYKLHEKTRGDIMFIKSELEPVHHLLWKLWGKLDLDAACKNWMTEARELSYDMEDDIDDFTLGLERGDGSFIQREATDSPFKEFMERVKDVSKKCGKMQKIGDAICNRSKLTTDPRAHFLHKDASELVGMEEKKAEVIQLLQKHEMVCILGPGGMGKTTLADLVYQTIVGDEFQCRAFVSVHPSPNMTEILGTILSQVTDGAMSAGSGTEPAAQQNIVTDISISLSDKRYLVIIDDIWRWEEWEVIRKALPKDNLGCKIIMTTRVRSIAEKCETEQRAGVYEQKFGRAEAERLSAMRLSKSVEGLSTFSYEIADLSTEIADMCDSPPFDFCPLAVICLSSAWAESHHVQGDDEEFYWARHVLYDGFLITPSLKPLVQSLCLGFDDLPVQLRTCLLYCTICPSMGYTGGLVRKWVAEGFVSQVEIAEAYFDKLVSRNLLEREQDFYYLIHPIILAFLVCKAKEDNFIAYHWGDMPNSSHAKQIRRLSLGTDRCPDEDVLSHTRSLVVCGKQSQLDGVPFKAFKKLRVLQIDESSGRLEYRHLVDICGLISLKCLDLMQCRDITELPREIGKLQNLETLYVGGTWIRELPTEIERLQNLETLCVVGISIRKLPTEIGKLQHLETLNVCGTKVTELPTWIEKLQSLKTLDVGCTNVTELPTCIEKLQSLKNLYVQYTKVKELPREIKNLERLETLDVSGTEVTELPTWIEKLQSLKTLNVSWTPVTELPKEIGKLQHLRTLDISGSKVREISCSKDPNPLLSVVVDTNINRLSVQVEKLMLQSGCEDVIMSQRDDLSILILFNHFGSKCEVLPVRMLRVAGRHMKVPQWVKQDLCNVCSLDIRLCKLVHEDLEFLKTQMPNLQALQLRFEVLPREPVAITDGGFSKLETFYVDCRLPRVITFGEGAMPKLKHLEFKFYTGTVSQDYYMGIKHLDSLEKVVFRCSGYYRSDSPGIREAIDVLRNEVAEHPNMITLWVNNMECKVFRSGEFEEWEKEIEKREKEVEKKRKQKRIEERLRLSTAAEGRAQRDKNNARAGIEKEIQERKRNLEIRVQRLAVTEHYYNFLSKSGLPSP